MSRRNQRGGAFVLSIFLLAIVTMLAIGVVTTAMTDLKISDNYARSMRDFYAADAGANHAVAMLQSDPETGNLAPYPSGTPIATGSLNGATYSIWLWNQRINGNGTTSALELPEARQFRVEGRDGRGGIRRIQGIIEPARRAPKAMEHAVFTCQAANLAEGEVEGDVYCKGDLTFGAKATKTVNVEVLGALTNTQKITGNARVNGAIHNNAQPINLTCKTASATIDKPSNCKGGYAMNASPNPAHDYCDKNSVNWDPNMINFTTTEIDKVHTATPAGNLHLGGWSTGANIALGNDSHYVAGGNVVWTGNTITYTGSSVLVIDGANSFTCDGCKIQPAGGAPNGSTISIVTRAGDIVFTSSANKSMTFFGVLWAGVIDAANNLPAAGSVTVSGKMYVELKGQIVALGGPVQVTGGNAKLDAQYVEAKPPLFGELDSYAITEWLEMQR